MPSSANRASQITFSRVIPRIAMHVGISDARAGRMKLGCIALLLGFVDRRLGCGLPRVTLPLWREARGNASNPWLVRQVQFVNPATGMATSKRWRLLVLASPLHYRSAKTDVRVSRRRKCCRRLNGHRCILFLGGNWMQAVSLFGHPIRAALHLLANPRPALDKMVGP